jgi:hypothetical protein
VIPNTQLLLVLSVGTCLNAQHAREFQVLVPDQVGQQGSAKSRATGEPVAVLGDQLLAILGERSDWSRTSRTVVVLDFGNLHSGTNYCLAAEILQALPLLRDRSKTTFVSTVFTHNDLAYTAEMGGGQTIAALWTYPAVLKTALRGCSSETPIGRGLIGSNALLRSASDILCELARSFPQSERPVRVFWLSDRFTWFDNRIEWMFREDFGEKIRAPHTIDACQEDISASGLTVFPVIFPNYPARRDGTTYNSVQLGSARYLAEVTGGFVTKANPLSGGILQHLIEQTDRGRVYRLSGVPNGRARNGLARELRLNFDEKQKRTFRREFVLSAKNAPAPAIARDLVDAIRVVAASASPGLEPCRPDPATSVAARGVRVMLPEEVTSAPAGKLRVWMEYLGNTSGMAKQRLVMDRPQGAKHDDDVGMCVPLPDHIPFPEFRMILYDTSTGWAGAVNGKIAPR